MELDIFDRARAITALQVAQDSGLSLQPRGERYLTLCPLHREKTPSFVIYPDGSWCCYGCGAAGSDGTSLYAALHGTTQADAARALVDRHALPTGPAQPSARDVLREVNNWKARELERLHGLLVACQGRMTAAMDGVLPEADFSPEFVEAARAQAEVLALIDQVERSGGAEIYQMIREGGHD